LLFLTPLWYIKLNKNHISRRKEPEKERDMSVTNKEHLPGITHLLRVGLVGDPVVHSYSPRFQQAALDALGIPARYELWQTQANELASCVASLLAPQFMGANITIPYKEAVLPLLDVVDPLATRIGAVNTIVHRNEYLYGYNTDAPGLLYALAEHGVGRRDPIYRVPVAEPGNEHTPPHHRDAINRVPTDFEALTDAFSFRGYTAVLLGAGGAARGAAFALVAAGVDRLIIVNRNLERAQRLAADVQQDSDCQVFSLSDPDFLIPHPSSLIINATPVGMHVANRRGRGREREQGDAEHMSPLPAEVLARFDPDTFVFDMIYNPIQTQLLCQARILGLRAVNGLPMLLHQGALAFTLWTGQPAPLEVMRAALLY
jgi:shikimate dehydrogenase